MQKCVICEAEIVSRIVSESAECLLYFLSHGITRFTHIYHKKQLRVIDSPLMAFRKDPEIRAPPKTLCFMAGQPTPSQRIPPEIRV